MEEIALGKVLIVGAGAVGNVATKKCAMDPEVFEEICLASRTLEKCEKIASEIDRPIRTEKLDADNVKETVDMIKSFKPDLLINVALPYQDLPLMDACLETCTNYMDTANYEPPDQAKFEYKWQWAYDNKFKQKGIMALLGCGFDPGITNVYCAYAQKHYFDEIHEIDIVDCNAGSHGKPFATNFNPEINIREITQKGKYWKQGRWIETEPMEISETIDFPEIGSRTAYLLYHEEEESLVKHIKGLKQIRFWMTFSDEYITYLRVLQDVGMTSIEAIDFDGHKIVPLQFLKALLPNPGSLGAGYTGKTCIGCIFTGLENGKTKKLMLYNVCDHTDCYTETGAQAVSYTTGVPAMLGAKLMLTKTWQKPGVYNIEQFDPDPFMKQIGDYGLPWKKIDL
jgi:saccharopine dehydrogenase (NAD+, L-lysine-forming)